MNTKAFDNKDKKRKQDIYLKIYMNKNYIIDLLFKQDRYFFYYDIIKRILVLFTFSVTNKIRLFLNYRNFIAIFVLSRKLQGQTFFLRIKLVNN